MPDRDPRRAGADGRAGGFERIAVVGDGRMGRAIVAALSTAGIDVHGPLGRGMSTRRAPIVLLAVPDAEIAAAAGSVVAGALVGHFSGASTLEPLGDHEGFSIHPLTTVTGAGTSFDGVPAAVAGSSARALETAQEIARTLGMRPFEVADPHRAAYHAAASIASNFVLTLEDFAERLAATAGVPRDAFAPLVRATIDNWQRVGAAAALTGPIARGDEATVARQRAAVAERVPERLALFDTVAEATRELAVSRESATEARS